MPGSPIGYSYSLNLLRPVKAIRGIPSAPGHAGHLDAMAATGGYTIALCLAPPEG